MVAPSVEKDARLFEKSRASEKSEFVTAQYTDVELS